MTSPLGDMGNKAGLLGSGRPPTRLVREPWGGGDDYRADGPLSSRTTHPVT